MGVKQYEDDFYGEEIVTRKKRNKPASKVTLDGRIIQRTGKIIPVGSALRLKVDESEIYEIVMDVMGQKLLNYKYQEMLVQGKIKIAASGEKNISVMSYL